MDNKAPYYNSWVALEFFVILLIFQPKQAAFFAIRPSDIWLWYCLIRQYGNLYNDVIPFKNRLLVKNFGLYLGIVAIIATLKQASYAYITLDISFVFNFYRFLRFLLIFKLVENIVSGFSYDDADRFWRNYTLVGVVVMILSFLEYYGIQPYKQIMMNYYYERPSETINEYIIEVDRLAGLLGNANATAIFLVSTLPYPLLKIVNRDSGLIHKTLYGAYILAAAYILIIMSGSRTAVFIALLIPVFILFSAARQLKDLLVVMSLILLLTITGTYLYHKFESDLVIQDRVVEAVQGNNFELTTVGLEKWVGRYELWQDRFDTFHREGNPMAFLLGLGYTRAYKDFSDNGFISAYINNGLIGLILKLILFYIFIKNGLLKAMRLHREQKIDFANLAFALSAFCLLLWEITADLTEHYKLGQLFYMFLAMILLMNGKVESEEVQ